MKKRTCLLLFNIASAKDFLHFCQFFCYIWFFKRSGILLIKKKSFSNWPMRSSVPACAFFQHILTLYNSNASDCQLLWNLFHFIIWKFYISFDLEFLLKIRIVQKKEQNFFFGNFSHSTILVCTHCELLFLGIHGLWRSSHEDFGWRGPLSFTQCSTEPSRNALWKCPRFNRWMEIGYMFGFCGKVRYVKILFFWKICTYLYYVYVLYIQIQETSRDTQNILYLSSTFGKILLYYRYNKTLNSVHKLSKIKLKN